MKKTALVLVITIMIASFGFSQVLGPPNYEVVEKVHPKPQINDVAPLDQASISAECLLYGNCVIDYPGPNDNPSITLSPVVLSKAQIEVQLLPYFILKNTPANMSNDPIFKCVIVDIVDTKSSEPRMYCITYDKNVKE